MFWAKFNEHPRPYPPCDGKQLQDEINAAIERHRLVLLEALRLLGEQLPVLARQREGALVAVIDQTLPAALKKAIIERAERLVSEYQENEAQQQQIRPALDSLRCLRLARLNQV